MQVIVFETDSETDFSGEPANPLRSAPVSPEISAPGPRDREPPLTPEPAAVSPAVSSTAGRARATMADVARQAGVSIATVSRVFNDDPTVRPENRARVADAISMMGYRPNRLAANLRRQKAEMIGVLVSDIENPHFTEMVRAVEDRAFRTGHRVLLCNTDESVEKQRAYLEVLAAERVRGVILAASDPGAPEISELLDLEIPIVAFDREVADPRAGAVVVDNVGGMRTATEHLIALGHRRIAMVAGTLGVQTGDERLAGYRQAMEAAGLVPQVAEGGFRLARGRAAVEALAADPEITALVAGNNLMSIGALQALRAAGRRVPEDVSLVTVDDPFWAELVEPPLTTLAQPVAAMAERAVELLLAGMAAPDEAPHRVVFDLELRVRGSSAPPR